MTRRNREFRVEHIPYGYLITFRAYGTWLHGRQGSVDRFHNVYGRPKLPRNEQRRQYNQRLLTRPPVKLSSKMRKIIESAVRETCDARRWTLWAFNVRTNHVHIVVSANVKPDRVRSAFKAMQRESSGKLGTGEVNVVLGFVREVNGISGLNRT